MNLQYHQLRPVHLPLWLDFSLYHHVASTKLDNIPKFCQHMQYLMTLKSTHTFSNWSESKTWVKRVIYVAIHHWRCTHHIETPLASTVITTFLSLVETYNILFHLCWHIHPPTGHIVICVTTYRWWHTHNVKSPISPTLTHTFSVVIGLQLASSCSKY